MTQTGRAAGAAVPATQPLVRMCPVRGTQPAPSCTPRSGPPSTTPTPRQTHLAQRGEHLLQRAGQRHVHRIQQLRLPHHLAILRPGNAPGTSVRAAPSRAMHPGSRAGPSGSWPGGARYPGRVRAGVGVQGVPLAGLHRLKMHARTSDLSAGDPILPARRSARSWHRGRPRSNRATNGASGPGSQPDLGHISGVKSMGSSGPEQHSANALCEWVGQTCPALKTCAQCSLPLPILRSRHFE